MAREVELPRDSHITARLRLGGRAKSARMTDIERGEFVERSSVTLHEYAGAWIDRYQGRGRRGFRENTRDE